MIYAGWTPRQGQRRSDKVRWAVTVQPCTFLRRLEIAGRDWPCRDVEDGPSRGLGFAKCCMDNTLRTLLPTSQRQSRA